MNKMWSLALILALAFTTGCATQNQASQQSRPLLERRADFGAAYTPFSEFTHHAEMKEGRLVRYTLNARDIIPSRMPAVNAAIEGLKAKCPDGVKDEVRDESRRRNSAIDPYNRNLSAMIWGVVEQPILVDLRVRFDCNLAPTTKKK